MNMLTKAAVQGAACGSMIGLVLLVGGRVWHPATVEAQANQGAVAEVVRARKFEVVDTAGKTRARLDVEMDSPTLRLYHVAGKLRASLGILSEGSSNLMLGDAAGVMRANLSVWADGNPDLMLWDAAGKMRAGLSISRDGSPSLLLRDAAGVMRAALGSTSPESAKTGETRIRPESSLVLFDEDEKVMWQAP